MESNLISKQFSLLDLQTFLEECGFESVEFIQDEPGCIKKERAKLLGKQRILFKNNGERYVFYYSDNLAYVKKFSNKNLEVKLANYQVRLIKDNWEALINSRAETIVSKEENEGEKYIFDLTFNELSNFIITYIGYRFLPKHKNFFVNEIRSESTVKRRFLLKNEKGEILAYLVISDFTIDGALSSEQKAFLGFMVDYFGLPYIDDYSEYLKKQFEEITLKEYMQKNYKKIDVEIEKLSKYLSKRAHRCKRTF